MISMVSTMLLETSEEQLQALPLPALSPVATLVPDLVRRLPGIAPLPPVAPEQAYSMLIGGLVDLFVALSRLHLLVLAWDDLQWADESTLLVINRLACLEQMALLQVLAYRPEDLSENRPLDSMLHYLRRNEHVQTLNLLPFSPEEVEEYLALHNIAPLLFPERLYQATQGNALFLVEAVRTLLEQKNEALQLQHADSTSFLLYSQQIRDVVLARVERLPTCALELLKIAAVIAHPFTLDLLCPQLSPDDYNALDVLLVRRFLVEVNPEQDYRDYEVRLAFSHEMVGQIVYASCTAPQLAQLHGQVAANMVRRYAPNTEMHAAEIAFHYCRSGPSAEPQVLRYEVEAGDYARHIFSYRQSLVHYDTALQLLPRLQYRRSEQLIDVAEWAARAHYGRGLVCEALLDWEGVQESQRNLSEWATTNKNIVFASSNTRRMAAIRSLMGYLPEAATIGISVVQHLQADAETCRDIQDHTQKSLSTMLDMTRRWATLVTVGTSHPLNEQPPCDDMVTGPFPPFYPAPSPTVQDWQEIIEALGTSQAALTLAEYGWVLLLQGLNVEAERCLKAALRAAEETDQVTYWILAAMHLSRVYLLYGQPEEGN